MKNVCLIGCGGVGRRHLEAMLKVKYEVNIEVVEPSISSIESTKELLPDFNNYFTTIEDVSDNIDICLIATTSNIRKKVVLELVEKKNVKNIILEKVVFQNEADFDEILKLFKEKNIKSWVNCHLRAQPLYKTLKRYIDSEHKNVFNYKYSDDFTLSTSAIHILDLFSYLCGDYNIAIKSIDSGTELKESRHNGCIDFNGNMEVINSKGDTLFVTKRNATFGEHMSVSINNQVYLDTSEGDEIIHSSRMGYMFEHDSTTRHIISYVWQSSLTNSYIEDIIEKSDCDLSTLEDSANLHKIMLNNFRVFLKEEYDYEVVDCPIT